MGNMIKDCMNEMLENLNENDVDECSPLVLAYIGDSVFDVFVRTHLVCGRKLPVHRLHINATEFVKASAQAGITHDIMNSLSDEEKYIVRRGRNAKSGTVPKNASIHDYRYATGFESLIGYLFLKKRFERLYEVLKMSIKSIEK